MPPTALIYLDGVSKFFGSHSSKIREIIHQDSLVRIRSKIREIVHQDSLVLIRAKSERLFIMPPTAPIYLDDVARFFVSHSSKNREIILHSSHCTDLSF